MRSVLCTVLRSDRHDLLEADSLRTARRALDSEPLDIVIADQRLPDGEGLALLDDVRAADSAIPVIVLSATKPLPASMVRDLREHGIRIEAQNA